MTLNIPEDLIIQIFMRLPVKSLYRFKSLSKFFLSLTEDPNFALSHSHLSPTRLLYLPRTAYSSHTLSIHLEHNSSLPINPTFLPPTKYCDIKGSCRGFLLLCHSFEHLFIWNPSTNVHKLIPSIPNNQREPNFYGFGYDPLKDDYLVVVTYIERRGSCYFSLTDNAWTQIDEVDDMYSLPGCSGTGTFFNDVIHRLAYRCDVGVFVILAFDPIGRRGFSSEVVTLPGDFNRDYKDCDLCVLGGFLGAYVAEHNATNIWIMKEYKDQFSWTMSTVLAFDDLPTKSLSPICSTKSGDIVGQDCSAGLLVWFDVEGKVLKHVSYSDDPHGCNAATYRVSIFTPS